MEKLFCLLVILITCVFQIQISETTPLKIHREIRSSQYSYNPNMDTSSEGDLVYSDVTIKQREARERLYRQLRQYGVPSDVAEMYVPRGMTIGDLLGHDKPNTSSEDDENDTSSTFDPWSIVWYIGSFGGLIAFFLVISCSEWCCLKSRTAAALVGATATTQSTAAHPATRCLTNTTRGTQPCDTPPPGYHLFAPPSYDVVFDETEEKRKFDVFVVPVHSVPQVMDGCLESSPPPEYSEIYVTPT